MAIQLKLKLHVHDLAFAATLIKLPVRSRRTSCRSASTCKSTDRLTCTVPNNPESRPHPQPRRPCWNSSHKAPASRGPGGLIRLGNTVHMPYDSHLLQPLCRAQVTRSASTKAGQTSVHPARNSGRSQTCLRNASRLQAASSRTLAEIR